MNMLTIFSRKQSLLTRVHVNQVMSSIMGNIRASLLFIMAGSILTAGLVVTLLVYLICNLLNA